MKKLTKLLTRFALFSATECAVLFGLPALAERHPFILLAVSLSVLAVYAIHKPAAKPKAAKHRTATHRKAYIENEHICPMIRKRRYPIHNNTVC